MSRLAPTGLRARLLLVAAVGSLVVVGAVVLGFNALLRERLYSDADHLLQERAAAQLRSLTTVDGKLRVSEAPDRAALDTQTWIFAGRQPIEQPRAAAAEQRAVRSMVPGPISRRTVASTDVRLYAVPVTGNGQQLGTVVVGASLRPYRSTAHTALIASLALGALTVLAIVAASWAIIGRALRPVARMTAQAAEWSEHDLSRRFFAGQPHDELTDLAATFDGLLERLSQALRREQRVTAEISHELRTPLARILAEAELVGNRARSPERYRSAIQSIRRSAQELQRAVETLLASARAERVPSGGASDAIAVVQRAADASRQPGHGDEVSLKLSLGAQRVTIAVETDLAERALIPVLENAWRHAESRVDVRISRDGDRVLFRVSDDGPGIDPAIRARIFEPGFRGSPQAGALYASAGLGLSLARRLAQAAGGELEAAANGEGATFVLSLPARDEPPSAS